MDDRELNELFILELEMMLEQSRQERLREEGAAEQPGTCEVNSAAAGAAGTSIFTVNSQDINDVSRQLMETLAVADSRSNHAANTQQPTAALPASATAAISNNVGDRVASSSVGQHALGERPSANRPRHRCDGIISHDLVRIVGEPRNRAGVATRNIKKGECVLFEQPVWAVRTGETFPEEAPRCPDVEWFLAYNLLRRGCNADFCKEYCVERLSDKEDQPAIIAWIAKETACSQATCVLMHRVVSNNALSLETACMRMTFGAGMYAKASFLNHSCDPNVISFRMGGNFVIYAGRDIAKGEEIGHSYIAPHLLLQHKEARADHLFFKCKCKRCEEEGPEEAEELRGLHFASNLAAAPGGLQLVAFLACLIEGDDDAVWDQGCQLFSKDKVSDVVVDALERHPYGGVQALEGWMQALWNRLLGGGSAETEDKKRCGQLWLDAVDRVGEAVGQAGQGRWGDVVVRQLKASAVIVAFVLGSVSESKCINALCDMARMAGGELDYLREDITVWASMVERGGIPILDTAVVKAQSILLMVKGK